MARRVQRPNRQAIARQRIARETGVLRKDAPERVALVYPSPYRAGMSSLGYQTMYREINRSKGRAAERAFLPDKGSAESTPLTTYEYERPVGDFDVVALSVAYEIEIAGVIQVLEQSGIPPLAADRDERHPFILAGGPLTFSNPLPLGPYVDAVLMGEAEDSIHQALDIVFGQGTRKKALRALVDDIPTAWVPTLHESHLPPLARCERIPAFGQITSPDTELKNMFLIEGSRGCSRGCSYCVMRRSTNGGMRIVPMERVLELIPEHAKRVGLVGAAISDHPKIAELVSTLADQGREVGLSSLRPDKLKPPMVTALKRAGHRTLTTAMDGASQRLRDMVDRRARINHLENAAQMVREFGFSRLKLYLIVGLPSETDEDIDELIDFATQLSRIAPLSLGIAPFVSKRNTPLDRLPFAGIDVVESRLARLREGARGRVDIRSTSARWAWIEYVLAQGGQAEGRALLDAVHGGGRFRDFRSALDAIPRREQTSVDPAGRLPLVG